MLQTLGRLSADPEDPDLYYHIRYTFVITSRFQLHRQDAQTCPDREVVILGVTVLRKREDFEFSGDGEINYDD